MIWAYDRIDVNALMATRTRTW